MTNPADVWRDIHRDVIRREGHLPNEPSETFDWTQSEARCVDYNSPHIYDRPDIIDVLKHPPSTSRFKPEDFKEKHIEVSKLLALSLSKLYNDEGRDTSTSTYRLGFIYGFGILQHRNTGTKQAIDKAIHAIESSPDIDTNEGKQRKFLKIRGRWFDLMGDLKTNDSIQLWLPIELISATNDWARSLHARTKVIITASLAYALVTYEDQPGFYKRHSERIVLDFEHGLSELLDELQSI